MHVTWSPFQYLCQPALVPPAPEVCEWVAGLVARQLDTCDHDLERFRVQPSLFPHRRTRKLRVVVLTCVRLRCGAVVTCRCAQDVRWRTLH